MKYRIIISIILLGILLPYGSNFFGGCLVGFDPYGYWGDLDKLLFIQLFNMFAVIPAALTYICMIRQPTWLRLLPTIFGYTFLSLGHFILNLSSDAQAGLGVVFIPYYAMFLIGLCYAFCELILGVLRLKRKWLARRSKGK